MTGRKPPKAYRAPKILGDNEGLSSFSGKEVLKMADAMSLSHVKHAIFADDQLLRGWVNK